MSDKTADLLRRAAALMRERAENATPGTWNFIGVEDRNEDPGDNGGWIHNGKVGMEEHAVAVTVPYSDRHPSDAEHIASWHPAVALAAADWLDYTAGVITDDDDKARTEGCDCPYCIGIPKAEALARAYLGETT